VRVLVGVVRVFGVAVMAADLVTRESTQVVMVAQTQEAEQELADQHRAAKDGTDQIENGQIVVQGLLPALLRLNHEGEFGLRRLAEVSGIWSFTVSRGG